MRTSRADRFLAATLAMLVCIVLAQTSEARVVQGFEPGDPAVTGLGDAGTKGIYQGLAPVGTLQYLITTIRNADVDTYTNQNGTDAVTSGTMNSAANFNGAAPILSPTGTAALDGSGVFIPFSILDASEFQLTLRIDFLSTEPVQGTPRNDFAFAAIFDTSHNPETSTTTFTSVLAPSQPFGALAGSPFNAHTGFQTITLSLAGLAPGDYLLGIGISDATDSNHGSGLLIDNVQIVPEPSALGLGLAGAVLLLALRGRFKKS